MKTLTLEPKDLIEVSINGMLEMPLENNINKDQAYILTVNINHRIGKLNLLVSVLTNPFGSKIRDILVSQYQSINGKSFFGLFDLNVISKSEDIDDNIVADILKELKNKWNLKIKNTGSIFSVIQEIQK